ncbi:hypothetical protein V6N11_004572 [Hibiscus sabdariffa]|uniref:Uncharacterized protein n=1 Tax=Hibiscus sabdariffa TaxID=183260 RepID=A0ABR2SH89_9ROSI
MRCLFFNIQNGKVDEPCTNYWPNVFMISFVRQIAWKLPWQKRVVGRATWFQTANQIHPETTKNVVASLKSSSDSSSGSIQSTASSSGNCIGEDEVANAICLGKKPLVEVPSTFNESRSLSEEDLLGNFNPTELPSFKPLGNVSSKQDFNAPTSINAIEDQPGAQD